MRTENLFVVNNKKELELAKSLFNLETASAVFGGCTWMIYKNPITKDIVIRRYYTKHLSDLILNSLKIFSEDILYDKYIYTDWEDFEDEILLPARELLAEYEEYFKYKKEKSYSNQKVVRVDFEKKRVM